jgi:hypothetical protein
VGKKSAPKIPLFGWLIDPPLDFLERDQFPNDAAMFGEIERRINEPTE